MRFCQSHWNQLRSAINAAGMGHLGAKDGHEAVERFKQEADGTATDDTFDPLMAAHNEILRRFLEPLGPDGLYVFGGDYCPLCELARLNPARPDLPDNWIRGVTADLSQHCVEKGLIAAN